MTDFTDPTNTTDSFTQSDLFDEYSDELPYSAAIPERKNDVIPVNLADTFNTAEVFDVKG